MLKSEIGEICLTHKRICMNMTAPPFDWNQARAFVATAQAGSFSAAARALGLTQPTLGRQVAALEQALDLVLFERIGRKLSLTPAGRDVLEHLRTMETAATQAALIATGRSETVAGEVCVSVTDLMALYVMPTFTAELRRVAPQITLRILASNSLSDLQRREADIAVRHVAPTQPELIARKVREAQGRLYASDRYIARHGPLDTVEAVAKADFIAIGSADEMVGYLRNWGVPITRDNICVTCDSGPAGWDMACRGLGITAMSDDLAPLFAQMQIVAPTLPPVPVPYWLTTHRELHSSKRIRLVFDRLAALLSQPHLPGVPG